jgi:hypothetical protein
LRSALNIPYRPDPGLTLRVLFLSRPKARHADEDSKNGAQYRAPFPRVPIMISILKTAAIVAFFLCPLLVLASFAMRFI